MLCVKEYKQEMAEKTIIGKMSLYETMTMIVPGTMIVFCLWLAAPEMWSQNIERLHLPEVNYLLDVAVGIVILALVYVAGLLNYRLVDWFWGGIGLRNNICMLKNSLQGKVDLHYKNVQALLKDKSVESLTNQETEDIYYEAYTYALKKNGRSNVPFLENQVAMLKGLIFPMSWVIYLLCPEPWGLYRWLVVIAVVTIMIVLALCRQKKTIDLVFEDYEYENRIEKQDHKRQ